MLSSLYWTALLTNRASRLVGRADIDVSCSRKAIAAGYFRRGRSFIQHASAGGGGSTSHRHGKQRSHHRGRERHWGRSDPISYHCQTREIPSGDDTSRKNERHDLTHQPPHPGCGICRSSRTHNVQHKASHENPRSIPLIVADDCFLRRSEHKTLLTCLITKLCPYQRVMACGVPRKGMDPRGFSHCQMGSRTGPRACCTQL